MPKGASDKEERYGQEDKEEAEQEAAQAREAGSNEASEKSIGAAYRTVPRHKILIPRAIARTRVFGGLGSDSVGKHRPDGGISPD